MIRRQPRSTQSRSSAASDVYKRQMQAGVVLEFSHAGVALGEAALAGIAVPDQGLLDLSLIHISEPTRPY